MFLIITLIVVWIVGAIFAFPKVAEFTGLWELEDSDTFILGYCAFLCAICSLVWPVALVLIGPVYACGYLVKYFRRS